MESTLERHTAGEGLPAVQARARELAAASVNANTRRAYEGALRRLRDWLAGRLLDDATLAEYLAARFEAGHSPAVAGQVVAAVRFYAKLGGQLAARGAVTKLRMWTPPWLASLTSNRGRWQSGQVRSLRGVGTPVGGVRATLQQSRIVFPVIVLKVTTWPTPASSRSCLKPGPASGPRMDKPAIPTATGPMLPPARVAWLCCASYRPVLHNAGTSILYNDFRYTNIVC